MVCILLVECETWELNIIYPLCTLVCRIEEFESTAKQMGTKNISTCREIIKWPKQQRVKPVYQILCTHITNCMVQNLPLKVYTQSRNSVLLWNLKVHNSLLLNHILGQLNQFHTNYFSKIHFNVILESMARSPKLPLPLRFSNQNSVCRSLATDFN